MNTDSIGVIFTGIAGVIASLSAFSATRTKQNTRKLKALSNRVAALEERELAALKYMYRLESELAERGLVVPDRPLALRKVTLDEEEERA